MESIKFGRRVNGLFIAMVGVFLAATQCCNAAQYKVGGDKGWVLGGTNYAAWAKQHQFRAGDTLVFQYAPETHSVMQVSQQDFKTCATTRPVLTATGGRNTIKLTRPGTYFFICGVAGHCTGGMKIAIQAVAGSADTTDQLSQTSEYINANPTESAKHP